MKNVGPKQRAMLSVMRNAKERGCTKGASFINADERAAVERLAARGLCEITQVGVWCGLKEVHARLID